MHRYLAFLINIHFFVLYICILRVTNLREATPPPLPFIFTEIPIIGNYSHIANDTLRISYFSLTTPQIVSNSIPFCHHPLSLNPWTRMFVCNKCISYSTYIPDANNRCNIQIIFGYIYLPWCGCIDNSYYVSL